MNSLAIHMLCISALDDLKKKKKHFLLNTVTHAWKLPPRVMLIHVRHDLLVPWLHYETKQALCNSIIHTFHFVSLHLNLIIFAVLIILS